MSIADNPYILVMLLTGVSTSVSALTVAFLNYRSQRRKESGSVSSSDAQTILSQGQQNFQGAVTLVHELRTEIERLTRKVEEQDKIINAQISKIKEQEEHINTLEDQVQALNKVLGMEKSC